MADAQTALNSLPAGAKEREEGYRQMVLGYCKGKDVAAGTLNGGRDAAAVSNRDSRCKDIYRRWTCRPRRKEPYGRRIFFEHGSCGFSHCHRGSTGTIRICLVPAREQQLFVVVADVHRTSRTLRRQRHDKSRQGRLLGGPRLETRRQDPRGMLHFTTA